VVQARKIFNAFDEMGGIADPVELARIKADNSAAWDKLENLIHQVFSQNEQGKELLDIWKEALIMTPTVTANSTQFQAGIAEGRKEFIRGIYLTIKKVESN